MRTIHDYLADDPEFWSPEQQAAFFAASDLIGVSEPGWRAAREWKHQRSAAFRAWRELSKRQRRQAIAEEVEASFARQAAT